MIGWITAILFALFFVFAAATLLGFAYFILQGIIMGIAYVISEIFDLIKSPSNRKC